MSFGNKAVKPPKKPVVMDISKAFLYKEDYEIRVFKSLFGHDSDLAFQLFFTESVTEILFVLARGRICSATIILF